jgi:hypothetical protein
MGWPRIVGFGWLADWSVGREGGFQARLFVGEVPGGVASCELHARFDQFKRKLISLSTQHTQLGELSMAVRIGLHDNTNAFHREFGANHACAQKAPWTKGVPAALKCPKENHCCASSST